MRRILPRLARFAALAASFASLPAAGAETLQLSTVETRLYVMVQVPEAALLKRLPKGIELNTYAQGPYKGANLVLLFIERNYAADPAAKPLAATMDRKFVLVVPIKNPANSPKQTLMVIGGWSADPAEVPGAYRNFGRASDLRREESARGSGVAFGTAEDAWTVAAEGAAVDLRVRYARSMATRVAPAEQHIYSSVDPAFYRIYRIDYGAELVRSVPAGVDRAQEFRLSVKGTALADLFDGSEKVIGVVNVPWYVRQILLPDAKGATTSG